MPTTPVVHVFQTLNLVVDAAGGTHETIAAGRRAGRVDAHATARERRGAGAGGDRARGEDRRGERGRGPRGVPEADRGADEGGRGRRGDSGGLRGDVDVGEGARGREGRGG